MRSIVLIKKEGRIKQGKGREGGRKAEREGGGEGRRKIHNNSDQN